jgi:hypothetical protein
MGPDIIYWTGTQFIVVQVKLRKLYKGNVLKAADTTELNNFYLTRKSRKIIKGYAKTRATVTEAMSTRQRLRVLVCSQPVAQPPPGVVVHAYTNDLLSSRDPLFEHLIELKAGSDMQESDLIARAIWNEVHWFESQ